MKILNSAMKLNEQLQTKIHDSHENIWVKEARYKRAQTVWFKYVLFKDKQNYSMLLEVKTAIILGRPADFKWARRELMRC